MDICSEIEFECIITLDDLVWFSAWRSILSTSHLYFQLKSSEFTLASRFIFLSFLYLRVTSFLHMVNIWHKILYLPFLTDILQNFRSAKKSDLTSSLSPPFFNLWKNCSNGNFRTVRFLNNSFQMFEFVPVYLDLRKPFWNLEVIRGSSAAGGHRSMAIWVWKYERNLDAFERNYYQYEGQMSKRFIPVFKNSLKSIINYLESWEVILSLFPSLFYFRTCFRMCLVWKKMGDGKKKRKRKE